MNKVKLLRLPSNWIPSNEGNITSFVQNFLIFFFFFFTYRVDTRKDFIINTNAGASRGIIKSTKL